MNTLLLLAAVSLCGLVAFFALRRVSGPRRASRSDGGGETPMFVADSGGRNRADIDSNDGASDGGGGDGGGGD